MVKPTKYLLTWFTADLLPTAECLDEQCNWGQPPSTAARRNAKWHTGETGHTTQVKTLRCTEFSSVGERDALQ
jgi:hypothetical protein